MDREDLELLVDWDDRDELTDAGMTGYVLATSYDCDGMPCTLWLLDLSDDGEYLVGGNQRPRHDCEGPLPPDVQAKVDAVLSRRQHRAQP